MEKVRIAVNKGLDGFEITGIDTEVYVALALIAEHNREYADLLIRYHDALDETYDEILIKDFATYVMDQLNITTF